jgi:hypothetical protein
MNDPVIWRRRRIELCVAPACACHGRRRADWDLVLVRGRPGFQLFYIVERMIGISQNAFPCRMQVFSREYL